MIKVGPFQSSRVVRLPTGVSHGASRDLSEFPLVGVDCLFSFRQMGLLDWL